MEIEEIYKSVPVGLPGSYKILCGIELAKIPAEKIKEFEARRNAPKEEAAPAQEPQPAQEAAPAAETPAEQAAVEQTPAAEEGRKEAAAPNENEPSSAEGSNE